jgi:O-methyltransferase
MTENLVAKLASAFHYIAKNKSFKSVALVIAMAFNNIIYGWRNRSRKYSDKTMDHHEIINPLASYAPWNADEGFLETYQVIRNHTLVDIYRCYEVWSLVEQSSKLEGALIEIGTWRGGSGALIARRAQSCGIEDRVYLCDTFEGVAKTSEMDSYYHGSEHDDATIEHVESLVTRFGLGNCRIVPGIFPQESAHLITDDTFRFCHIDVDAYESARDIFDWIWDRLVIGGTVVYDDYGFLLTDGITKHVNGLRLRDDLLSIHNLNGHNILIKLH